MGPEPLGLKMSGDEEVAAGVTAAFTTVVAELSVAVAAMLDAQLDMLLAAREEKMDAGVSVVEIVTEIVASGSGVRVVVVRVSVAVSATLSAQLVMLVSFRDDQIAAGVSTTDALLVVMVASGCASGTVGSVNSIHGVTAVGRNGHIDFCHIESTCLD